MLKQISLLIVMAGITLTSSASVISVSKDYTHIKTISCNTVIFNEDDKKGDKEDDGTTTTPEEEECE